MRRPRLRASAAPAVRLAPITWSGTGIANHMELSAAPSLAPSLLPALSASAIAAPPLLAAPAAWDCVRPEPAGLPIPQAPVALKHVRLEVQYEGEKMGILQSRKIAPWYFKGCPNVAQLRNKTNRATSLDEMTALIRDYEGANE